MPISPEVKKAINTVFLKVLHWFKMFTIIIVIIFILVNLIMSILQIGLIEVVIRK